jgi:hypothetical protein
LSAPPPAPADASYKSSIRRGWTEREALRVRGGHDPTAGAAIARSYRDPSGGVSRRQGMLCGRVSMPRPLVTAVGLARSS